MRSNAIYCLSTLICLLLLLLSCLCFLRYIFTTGAKFEHQQKINELEEEEEEEEETGERRREKKSSTRQLLIQITMAAESRRSTCHRQDNGRRPWKYRYFADGVCYFTRRRLAA